MREHKIARNSRQQDGDRTISGQIAQGCCQGDRVIPVLGTVWHIAAIVSLDEFSGANIKRKGLIPFIGIIVQVDGQLSAQQLVFVELEAVVGDVVRERVSLDCTCGPLDDNLISGVGFTSSV